MARQLNYHQNTIYRELNHHYKAVQQLENPLNHRLSRNRKGCNDKKQSYSTLSKLNIDSRQLINKISNSSFLNNKQIKSRFQ